MADLEVCTVLQVACPANLCIPSLANGAGHWFAHLLATLAMASIRFFLGLLPRFQAAVVLTTVPRGVPPQQGEMSSISSFCSKLVTATNGSSRSFGFVPGDP